MYGFTILSSLLLSLWKLEPGLAIRGKVCRIPTKKLAIVVFPALLYQKRTSLAV
jgi:hypothetical protein